MLAPYLCFIGYAFSTSMHVSIITTNHGKKEDTMCENTDLDSIGVGKSHELIKQVWKDLKRRDLINKQAKVRLGLLHLGTPTSCKL